MGVKDIRNLGILFDPSVTRSTTVRQVESYTQLTLGDIGGSIGASSGTFLFDPPGSPLKSTQQIPLDFSKFENHTFFNSAESNVNVAFERVINHYPFDGTFTEREEFLQSLTGFERYVYDQFPKYKNFARWIGTVAGAPITVRDFAGTDYPTLSKDKSGKSILDPGMKSISFEMHFHATSADATARTIIFQKLSGSNGITLTQTGSSGDTTNAEIGFYVSSGTLGLSASMTVPKGEWSHIVATFDREPGAQKLKLYKNAELQATSSAAAEFGKIDFSSSPLYIGSGSVHSSPGFDTYTPTLALTGAIDELRIFHATRSLDDQHNYATKNIFTSNDLKLYYRFNAPTGSYGGNTVVLDSSGNSLHGSISTTAAAQIIRGKNSSGVLIWPGVSNPMILERPEDNPVLFPGFDTTVSLNSTLLTSASQYDANNPNLITRLVPQHYLLEAAQAEGFADEDANTGDAIFANTAFPGGAQIPSSQIIASLLFMYGKFFDELKIYIDQFSQFDNVQYDANEGLADTFLVTRAEQMGFNLPSQFTAAKFAQFLLAQNVGVTSGLSAESMRDAQNKLWRRVLVSLPEIIRSKGTRAAVNGILNTLGLEHQKVFRTVEFGGRNVDNIKTSVRDLVIDLKFLDFSGSLVGTDTTDARGFASDKPVIKSVFLSASKVEPGVPLSNTFLPRVADNGMLTSASFTVEGLYKFDTPLTGTHFLTQSLVRFLSTGSAGVGTSDLPWLWANVVAFRPVQETGAAPALRAFFCDQKATLFSSSNGTPSPLSMSLDNVDVTDGNIWHVSFGRERALHQSASYFLNAKKLGDESSTLYSARSLASTYPQAAGGLFINNAFGLNASGTFLAIGSQSIGSTTGFYSAWGLNGTEFNDDARATEFSGKLAQLRFWTKALTKDEISTHALSPDSLGVVDPNVNFCFGNTLSGSWERLRLATTMQQPITTSNAAGEITLFDYAQSEVSGVFGAPWLPSINSPLRRVVKFHMSGTGFEASKRIIKKEQVRTTQFTPQFDVNSSDNKVQIETLQDASIAETLAAISVNDKDYLRSNKIENDNRFLVEVSTSQALNEDIMKIFGTLEALENAIGTHQTTFSEEYPDMRHLREIYFNRLESKINLSTFFDFFRFFDDTLTSLIASVLPQNTNFLGVRFIVSPHTLERGKYKYYGENGYLSENLRWEDNEFSDFHGEGEGFVLDIGG